jgi:hypothetical protein
MSECVIKFNTEGILKCHDVTIQYSDSVVSLIGGHETFVIPYGSIKYIRVQNKKE